MKMSSIARAGSVGNKSLLSKYGGKTGSGPAARNKYANGGAVTGGVIKRADGGSVDGDSAPKRLDRPGRKMKGKDKGKKGTNINVVVMAGKGDQPATSGPMPPMAGPPPMPPRPMPMPPPPGPGGPPMGMHKHGGKVKAFKKGGRVKRDDGGPVNENSSFAMSQADKNKDASKIANTVIDTRNNMRKAVNKITGPHWPSSETRTGKAAGGQVTSTEKEALKADGGFKKGGKIKAFMKHRAMGGSVKGDGELGKLSMKSQKGDGVMDPAKGASMGSKGVVKIDAGSGGAMGRMEKMKAYGRSKGGKC